MADYLVCEETSESWINDIEEDFDVDDIDVNNRFMSFSHGKISKSVSFRSFPMMFDDSIEDMVKKETDFLPGNDYLKRLRDGFFEFRVRNEALHWILKACVHHNFGPLCIYLAMNYLDRFLTASELPKDKAWAVQLLAVSCLSLAAKVEETNAPQTIDLQVENPKFVFEAKTIKRMELLILNKLNWRLQMLTPFAFIDFFANKINDFPSETYIYRTSQLILNTTKEVEFLDFKPSEIAAAAAIAISCSGEAVFDDEKTITSLVHVKQERVMRCLKMMRGMSSNLISPRSPGPREEEELRVVRVPESPNGVLEATWLSYKSDETQVWSCTNSTQSSLDNKKTLKRRKLQ